MSQTIQKSHDEIRNHSCFDRLISFFRRAFKRQNTGNVLAVHAVDSVRLMYMRRILSSQDAPTVTQTKEVKPDRTYVPAVFRRQKVNNSHLKAIEEALHTYEMKNKDILQLTASPKDKYLSVPSILTLAKKNKPTDSLQRDSEDSLQKESKTKKKSVTIAETVIMKDDTISDTCDDEEEKNICFDVESMSIENIKEYS